MGTITASAQCNFSGYILGTYFYKKIQMTYKTLHILIVL